MDPLSIICAAGSASQAVVWVSTRLYTFITSSKTVEKTLNDLLCEVNDLNRVLQSIERSLKGPVTNRKHVVTADEDETWVSLDLAVKDTQHTICALHGTVQALTTQKATTFFRRAVKQVKLNLDADEIKEIKGRVHTHTSCLQLALQMATIIISSRSSSHIQELSPKLDELIQDLRLTHPNLHTRLPSSFKNPDIASHTERLISSASTVIGQSTVWGGSEAELPQYTESGGGSLNVTKKSHIEKWIPQTTIPEEERSQTSEHKALTATTDTAVDDRGFELEDVDYSDSDGDDNFDCAEKCFELARKSFVAGEHAKAAEYFRAGLERSDRLSMQKQDQLDCSEVKRELAVSLLHQGDLDGSEKLFQSLLGTGSGNKRRVATALHASYGLASICLCRRSYPEAEDWCKKSRVGWRRAVKRQHPFYYIDTLKLTAFLYELKADLAYAQVYADMANETPTKIDESLEAPSSPAFTFEQARDLIKKYHQTNPHPGSVHDLPTACGAETNIISPRASPVEASPALQQAFEMNEASHGKSDSPRPLPEVKICDLGTSPQSEIGEVLQEAGPFPKRSSALSCGTTSPGSPASTRDLRLGSRTESVISKEAPSLGSGGSGSQHGEVKSFSSRARDSRIQSSLLSAARKGDVASIEKYLAKGAPIDAVNGKGESPLCLAVICGHRDAVQSLIKHHSMIEAKTKQGLTPLLCAKANVAQSRLGVMQALLAAGANIHAKDNDGNTALFHAVAASRLDWTKLLLEYHSSLEIRNNIGQTALLCALDFPVMAFPKPLLEIVTLLLDSGSDAKATDIKGQTAIFIAVRAMAMRTAHYERCWGDYAKVLELLCSNGADARALSVKGVSPMSLTGQIKDTELKEGVRKTLKRHGAT